LLGHRCRSSLIQMLRCSLLAEGTRIIPSKNFSLRTSPLVNPYKQPRYRMQEPTSNCVGDACRLALQHDHTYLQEILRPFPDFCFVFLGSNWVPTPGCGIPLGSHWDPVGSWDPTDRPRDLWSPGPHRTRGCGLPATLSRPAHKYRDIYTCALRANERAATMSAENG